MSELILKFPRTLESRFWDNNHHRLWVILVVLTVLFVPAIIFLSQLPPQEITQREREEYLRVIYRAPAISEEVAQEIPAEIVGEEEVTVTRKTLEERRADSQRRINERITRKERRLEQIRSTGLFTAAGAQVPTFEIGNGKALSLTGGSLQGLIAQSMEEISTRPDLDIIEEFQEEGIIREVELDLEITKLQIPVFENIIREASVELKTVPIIRSKAEPEMARSAENVKEFIDYNVKGLQSCYLTQKNKDKSLKGSLLVKCIILQDGTVSSVRFRNSRWSNPALGRRVERCLKQKILLWKFDPSSVDEETPIDFPLIFS